MTLSHLIISVVIICTNAQPPELIINLPVPLEDLTDYTETFSTKYDDQDAAALGSTPEYWDGEIRATSTGLNVVTTVKTQNNLPQTMDIAHNVVEYMTQSITNPSVIEALSQHNIYIYHCDPTMQTGVGLYAKQGQYDYVSDLINYDQSTHDGRAVDQVYGYGGSRNTPTTTCDCNVLGYDCAQNAHKSESILVHEFGHTIMDLGLQYGNPSLYNRITGEIFNAYRNKGYSYAYALSTPQEMWACGLQTWLVGSSRTDTAPGIYTVNDMYYNLQPLYNALYETFGQPAKHLIPSLSSVSELTNTAWNYYDFHVNTYGDSDLKSRWNAVKNTGSATGSTSTTTTTRATVTTTTTTTTSGSSSNGELGCGNTMTGTLNAGDIAYHYFQYTSGARGILMWPCGTTQFNNKISVIDRYWNYKGSDTSSAYGGSCSTHYQDSNVWILGDDLISGGEYWLVIQGQSSSDNGYYSVTMYCYDAAGFTAELDISSGNNGNSSGVSISVLIAIILIILVLNIIGIFCLFRYVRKKGNVSFDEKLGSDMDKTTENDEKDLMEVEIEVETTQ